MERLDEILKLLAQQKSENTDVIEGCNICLFNTENKTSNAINYREITNNFLKNQKIALMQTIESIRTDNGRELIKGYKDNYFNEIIQNANDLYAGDCVNVSIVDKDDNIELICCYKDYGFEMKDIYGFCNTSKGSKTENQTGKFGIGIKAILAAALEFSIKSNVIISNEGGKESIVLNQEWDRTTTRLRILLHKEQDRNIVNIAKIVALQKLLEAEYIANESKIDEIKKMFLSSKSEELVFDLRSLIFTDAKVNNDNEIKRSIAKKKSYTNANNETDSIDIPCITRIVFNDLLSLECHIEGNENEVSLKYISLKLNDDVLFEDKIFLFNDIKNRMRFGFSLTEDINRVYSVYYIKEFKLEEKIGILIHTENANSFRNDIASDEKTMTKVNGEIYDAICEIMKSILQIEISNSSLKRYMSIIFHKCLLTYSKMEEDAENNVFQKCIQEQLTNEKLIKYDFQKEEEKYVVDDKGEEEEYRKYYSEYETCDLKIELEKCYNDVFSKGEVITKDSIKSNGVHDSLKDLYKNIDSEWVKNILCYYGDVSEFIKFRIYGKCKETSVDRFTKWLNDSITEDNEKSLRRIIGRYKIVKYIGKYGNIVTDEIKFIDYLFGNWSEIEKTSLGKEIIKKYMNDYMNLKDELVRKVDKFTYYEPYSYSLRGWNGYYDYYNPCDSCNSIENIKGFLCILKTEKLAEYIRNVEGKLQLFSSNDMPDYYEFKKNYFAYKDTYCVSTVNINFLKDINVDKVEELIEYQNALDMLKVGLAINCTIKNISLKKLSRLLEWLIKRENAVMPKITIENVEFENEKNEFPEEKRQFIIERTKGIISDVLSHSLEMSEGRKHIVAYLYKSKLYIQRSKGTGFIDVECSAPSKNNNLFLFHGEKVEQEIALAEVLKKISLGDDIDEQIKGFVAVSTIGESVTSSQYEKIENSVNGYWEHYRRINERKSIQSVKTMKKLLLARGSYNGKCPLCGKEINNLNETILFSVFLKNNKCFQSVSCIDCNDILKKALVSINFDEADRKLEFECKYYLGDYQGKEKKILLKISDVNICINDLME